MSGIAFLLAICISGPVKQPVEILPGLEVIHGPVNGVRIRKHGKEIAVYGDPRAEAPPAEMVLFTHHRRDVVWAGRRLVENGARSVVPAGEAELFSNPAAFWRRFAKLRLQDTECQSTKVCFEPMRVDQAVKEGDTVSWEGLEFRVLDTPGFTRKSVSYVLELEGRKVAFTGDLIYGEGKLFDLYSLQDAIPEAGIGGYHGYAARAASVLLSLEKLKRLNPHLVIPARGPVIRNPQAAFSLLAERLKKLFRNYLSTDALRWYFGKEHVMKKAERILGPKAPLPLLSGADLICEKPPDWLIPFGTSRIIVSKSGGAFLLDCGSRAVFSQIEKLKKQGVLRDIEGIYVTHYHGDHTGSVGEAAARYRCPVYACREQKDILEHPKAYHMPAMTPNPIPNVIGMENGRRHRWHEYTFTFFYFPGQTLYHGALLVESKGKDSILFVGDSFTPGGIDDYCLLNRNILRPGWGYLRCLDLLGRLKPAPLLVNEHVVQPFRFSPEQIKAYKRALTDRIAILQKLLPWEDVNFGLDEQWVRCYPYGLELEAGGKAGLEVVLLNHAAQSRPVRIKPHVPASWEIQPPVVSFSAPPLVETRALFTLHVAKEAKPGLYGVTFDIDFGSVSLRCWSEALLEVRR